MYHRLRSKPLTYNQREAARTTTNYSEDQARESDGKFAGGGVAAATVAAGKVSQSQDRLKKAYDKLQEVRAKNQTGMLFTSGARMVMVGGQKTLGGLTAEEHHTEANQWRLAAGGVLDKGLKKLYLDSAQRHEFSAAALHEASRVTRNRRFIFNGGPGSGPPPGGAPSDAPPASGTTAVAARIMTAYGPKGGKKGPQGTSKIKLKGTMVKMPKAKAPSAKKAPTFKGPKK